MMVVVIMIVMMIIIVVIMVMVMVMVIFVVVVMIHVRGPRHPPSRPEHEDGSSSTRLEPRQEWRRET